MRDYKFYWILLVSLFSFAACDVINPEEEIPSYIEILPFTYTGTDGSNSQRITDAWISVDGEFIGAFDLPKTIPVLASGSQSVIIDSGIKENGFNSLPTIYPFYERFTTTLDLVPGAVTTVQPDTRYDLAEVQIIFNESFNDGLFAFSEEVEKTLIDVKEGEGSGLIKLDTADFPSVTVNSDPLDKFPDLNTEIYVELDYKSDVPIFVGIIGYNLFGEITLSDFPHGLKSNDEWRKVYLNFTDIFNALLQSDTDRYELLIGGQLLIDNGEFTLENAEIRLDNVKLVTF